MIDFSGETAEIYCFGAPEKAKGLPLCDFGAAEAMRRFLRVVSARKKTCVARSASFRRAEKRAWRAPRCFGERENADAAAYTISASGKTRTRRRMPFRRAGNDSRWAETAIIRASGHGT
jgi:hypothetical protein